MVVDGLAQMPFACGVLDQEHFARPNNARLTIAGGDLDAIVQVDDVLPARCRMPVKVVGWWYFPENNARGWEALGEPSSRRGLDVLHFFGGKVGFALVIRIESVNFHTSPPVWLRGHTPWRSNNNATGDRIPDRLHQHRLPHDLAFDHQFERLC